MALSGAHALGRCHADASGYEGPWQRDPTLFSNIFFRLLLKGGAYWTPDDTKQLFQYKDPSGTLMMLPSDIVLVQDAGFKPYVEAYAKDQKARACARGRTRAQVGAGCVCAMLHCC